jgi:hypothetical protein
MKSAATVLKLEIDGGPAGRIGEGREGGRDVKLAAFVVQLVALSTDVGAGAIASRSRQCADAARARQIAMYLVHTACEWRLARVASAFGRDRSTISYACRRVEDQREDASFDGWLLRLEGCIRAVAFGGVAA